MKVSIIMPTLNEERNLPYVLPRIPQCPEIAEILLVDGHSSDETVRIAKQLRADIKVIYQQGKGKGNAIAQAAREAAGDYFLILDADGSQQPEEIPSYIEKAKEGFDLVKGSRYMKGGSTADETKDRKVIVRTANTVANLLWRTKFSDICYGMFLVNKEKYLSLNIGASGFDVEWEMMIRAKRKGLRIAEIPSVEQRRRYGNSNISYLRDGWRISKKVFREALRRGDH